MAIFRINKTKDYTVMSNSHLKNKEMSLKAKGLLSVMLALPDDWDYSIAGLVAISKEEETAIENTIKELKKLGYLRVDRITPDKSESGRMEYEYNVFEQPQKQGVGFLGVENLGVEFLGVENRPQYNTNKLNTEKLNIKNKKEPSFEEIIANYTQDENLRTTLFEFVKKRNKIRKPIEPSGLQRLLTKANSGLFALSRGNDAIGVEIVNQSIDNCWLGFYALKDPKVNKSQETLAERIAKL